MTRPENGDNDLGTSPESVTGQIRDLTRAQQIQIQIQRRGEERESPLPLWLKLGILDSSNASIRQPGTGVPRTETSSWVSCFGRSVPRSSWRRWTCTSSDSSKTSNRLTSGRPARESTGIRKTG